jgi:O-antigen/teichoic acid export membrane protein
MQIAAEWLERELLSVAPVVPLHQRLLHVAFEGKTVFLVASTGVNGINMLFNLVMGRLLTPAAYSQLTLLVTLHLIIGLLPTAAQTAAARFSAIYATNNNYERIVQLKYAGRRLMWGIGIVLSLIILIAAAPLAHLFQLEDPILLLPLALGTAFYVSMSIDRGILQGINGFYWLAAAYLSESVLRFIISVAFGLVLVSIAARLQGGAWAVGESMAGTWFISWLALRHFAHTDSPGKIDPAERKRWLGLAGLTLIALAGQALIANSDFLLVKSLFTSEQSGLYASVSVLGRIVYFGALPLTIVLVPFIARKQALGEPTRPTFLLMLAGGAAFCSALLLVTLLFAPLIVRLLYGDAYVAAASLLAVYTLAASLYVMTNLVVTYRVALGRGGDAWMPLAAGVLQVIGILIFHQTLLAVILVQVVLMALLLVVTLWRGLSN